MNKLLILLIVLILSILVLIISTESFITDSNNKLQIYDECKYDGIGFGTNHEIGECSIAIQIIPLVDNVLEIGGGAGKVSHMINSILAKRNLETQHVVVEPGIGANGNHGDHDIYANKEKFNDKYTIVKKLCNDLNMNDIKIFDKPPECLYVDCEGCLKECQTTPFFDYVLKNVKYIVNEMDGYNEIITEQWSSYGFKK